MTFKIANAKELEGIYEDFPMNLARDQWQEMYEYATSGRHDFLYCNHQKQDPKERCMKNFQEVLFYQ